MSSRTRTKPAEPPVQAPEPELEPAHEEPKNQPVHVVRIRNVRAAIWQNQSGEGATYHTITVSRFYKDGDGWRTSQSFGRDDALLLAKAIDQAHTWITFTQQDTDTPF